MAKTISLVAATCNDWLSCYPYLLPWLFHCLWLAVWYTKRLRLWNTQIWTSTTVESRYIEVDGTIFYKFKLPEVQINLHFGWFELVKRSQTPNYCWRKQSKCFFDSDRRFELCKFRDIRVRDIEIRPYFLKLFHLFCRCYGSATIATINVDAHFLYFLCIKIFL